MDEDLNWRHRFGVEARIISSEKLRLHKYDDAKKKKNGTFPILQN